MVLEAQSCIKALRVRAVRVPMQEPHLTASGVVSESPLVLSDVTSSDGVTGHSIVFTYTTMALAPTHITWHMRSSRAKPRRRFNVARTGGA